MAGDVTRSAEVVRPLRRTLTRWSVRSMVYSIMVALPHWSISKGNVQCARRHHDVAIHGNEFEFGDCLL